MKGKKFSIIGVCVLAAAFVLAGCGNTGGGQAAESVGTEAVADAANEAADAENEYGLKDGTYVVSFTTDNTMFHVSEANEDKGILTVENGEMTVHVSLQSKKVVNLFSGLAEDAQKDGAQLLEPTLDTVTYSDGISQEVYGFDIPVPAIDEEFDVALIGTHGNWYDHKVVVSDPVPGTAEDLGSAPDEAEAVPEEKVSEAIEALADTSLEPVTVEDQEDGSYTINVEMTGGTGRASVESPTELVIKDSKAYALIIWSSPYYDYMLVGEEKLLPVNTSGNSVFVIPVTALDEAMEVVGDTTAMSEAHEISYELTFDGESISAAE